MTTMLDKLITFMWGNVRLLLFPLKGSEEGCRFTAKQIGHSLQEGTVYEPLSFSGVLWTGSTVFKLSLVDIYRSPTVKMLTLKCISSL